MLWAIYIFGISMIAVSCGRHPEQAVEESQSLRHTMDMFRMYSMIHSNQSPTNLQQLYTIIGRPYPYAWHRDFKKYGKYAGFEKSFFEKYWFFPPGSTSQIAGGQVVLMTAHPFPTQNGKLGRSIAIYKADPYGNYGYGTAQLSEDLIQRILNSERIKPYDLPIFPAPPPEPIQPRMPGEAPGWLMAVNRFFGNFAERSGIGIRYGVFLRNITGGLFMVAGCVAAWLLWRQTRRN